MERTDPIQEMAGNVLPLAAARRLNTSLHAIRQCLRREPDGRWSISGEVGTWFIDAFDRHWPWDDDSGGRL